MYMDTGQDRLLVYEVQLQLSLIHNIVSSMFVLVNMVNQARMDSLF